MMNYFIFDIDGTLINTFDMYMPALFATLEDHGYHFTPTEQQQQSRKMYGLAAKVSLQELGVPANQLAAINEEWINRAYEQEDRTTVFPTIPAIVAQLAAIPGNQLAIVTSKTGHEYQQHFQQRYRFAQNFSFAVTADDTTKHKPDPAPILLALQKMNADPHKAVYIGDMATDQQAAHSAGIKFAGAKYGSVNPQGIASADFLLHTPADLLKLCSPTEKVL